MSNPRITIIAKNRNTYAKRQREFEKKQRADDKLAKRQQKQIKGPSVDQFPTMPPTTPVPLPD